MRRGALNARRLGLDTACSFAAGSTSLLLFTAAGATFSPFVRASSCLEVIIVGNGGLRFAGMVTLVPEIAVPLRGGSGRSMEATAPAAPRGSSTAALQRCEKRILAVALGGGWWCLIPTVRLALLGGVSRDLCPFTGRSFTGYGLAFLLLSCISLYV